MDLRRHGSPDAGAAQRCVRSRHDVHLRSTGQPPRQAGVGSATTYAYDLANQLTTSQDASGVTTYTYDLAGNLHVVEHPSGQRDDNTWDDQNRQTRVLLPAGGIVTSAYRFDGLRHEKADSQGVAKYIWDFQNYLAETDATNSIKSVSTIEPRTYGSLLSQWRKTDTIWVPRYHHWDGIGSTRALSDASGSICDTYLYDSWGNELAATGTTPNRFRWVGRAGMIMKRILILSIFGLASTIL